MQAERQAKAQAETSSKTSGCVCPQKDEGSGRRSGDKFESIWPCVSKADQDKWETIGDKCNKKGDNQEGKSGDRRKKAEEHSRGTEDPEWPAENAKKWKTNGDKRNRKEDQQGDKWRQVEIETTIDWEWLPE